jgi:5-methylcytosine-specific restriction endonuclease McrA
MKTCTKCAENKPPDQFYRARHAKDGRDSRCIACEKARLAKWAEDNPERRREAQARYNATDKAQERQRRWRENNPDRVLEVASNWRKRNPEGAKLASRRYYHQNPEQSMERTKQWRRENPEAARIHRKNASHKRRAAIRSNGVFGVTTKDIARLLSQPCAYCGSTESPTVDHIIPIARGGRHSVGNLQCLCASCNFSKHDSLMVEFRYRKREVAA